MTSKQKCPECGYGENVRAGSQHTKRWGKRPRLKCKQCATTFYEDIVKENKNEKEVSD